MQNTADIEAIRKLIADRVPMRTARALSRTIIEMVVDGELSPGTRMPVVRDIASSLAMSTTNVANAWRELVDWRVLETKRRGGTVVLGPPRAPRARRAAEIMTAAASVRVNLAYTLCDPKLILPMPPALLAAVENPAINDYLPVPISPLLKEAIIPRWPFSPSFLLATHGGLCATDMALRTCVRPGDRVMVEVPCMSRVLDVLESIGAITVPIEQGEDGPNLAQVEKALRSRPVAFLYQPAGSYPTGSSVTADWVERAARLLKDKFLAIIELVMVPLLNRRPILSIGRYLPHSTVHIQSFIYVYGPNIRVGVAGGSDYYIDRMWQQFTFASRWVSRILQDAVAFNLTDPTALRQLDAFLAECHRRQTAFTSALNDVGFSVREVDTPMLWLDVRNESAALESMLKEGILVHRGSYYSPTPRSPDHIVVNGMLVGENQREIAGMLARAAKA